MEERWQVVANASNALNAGTPYAAGKTKRNWFNLASYKKDVTQTGGISKAETPMDLQFEISEMIGEVCMEGVPCTLLCNTSLNKTQAAKEILADYEEANSTTILPTTLISPLAKRRKKDSLF